MFKHCSPLAGEQPSCLKGTLHSQGGNRELLLHSYSHGRQAFSSWYHVGISRKQHSGNRPGCGEHPSALDAPSPRQVQWWENTAGFPQGSLKAHHLGKLSGNQCCLSFPSRGGEWSTGGPQEHTDVQAFPREERSFFVGNAFSFFKITWTLHICARRNAFPPAQM